MRYTLISVTGAPHPDHPYANNTYHYSPLGVPARLGSFVRAEMDRSGYVDYDAAASSLTIKRDLLEWVTTLPCMDPEGGFSPNMHGQNIEDVVSIRIPAECTDPTERTPEGHHVMGSVLLVLRTKCFWPHNGHEVQISDTKCFAIRSPDDIPAGARRILDACHVDDSTPIDGDTMIPQDDDNPTGFSA